MKKIVYVPLAADILHEGHLNILKIASKYGKVIVGLLTDAAIIKYKNLPFEDESFDVVINLSGFNFDYSFLKKEGNLFIEYDKVKDFYLTNRI